MRSIGQGTRRAGTSWLAHDSTLGRINSVWLWLRVYLYISRNLFAQRELQTSLDHCVVSDASLATIDMKVCSE